MEENQNNNELNDTAEKEIREPYADNENTVNAMAKKQSGKPNIMQILAVCFSFVALVIAIIALVGGAGSKEEDAPVKKGKLVQTGSLKIAYVNTDTIMAKYNMALEMQKELESKQNTAKNSFQSKQAALQRDYETYMKTGTSLTLTQQKAKEKDLQQRAQELNSLQTSLPTQLAEETAAMNKKLLDAVYAFVRDYNAKHDKYNVILVKSYASSPTLYMDEGMDITDEILKGLNEEYKEYKKK